MLLIIILKVYCSLAVVTAGQRHMGFQKADGYNRIVYSGLQSMKSKLVNRVRDCLLMSILPVCGVKVAVISLLLPNHLLLCCLPGRLHCEIKVIGQTRMRITYNESFLSPCFLHNI